MVSIRKPKPKPPVEKKTVEPTSDPAIRRQASSTVTRLSAWPKPIDREG